ncbi:MAG: hypothetical protein RMZ41_012955 [Nostoc sp. DedVER02]|uniref:hypothetical protein n=1 Tax=unclassified Nostoc TaxID=2593658 RepID=UPI002AD574FC|nr:MULTISPECIES: hypothetical protein [unclassified Nostoc]MDZ7988707.1 hypothetical protein [Nostoc sp. DedVER02]MDZ8113223.1 hypothetical protein [Nostoc sp. DedVER01b]
MNRRLYKRLIIVETAIYRVFVMIDLSRLYELEFPSKNINLSVLWAMAIYSILNPNAHS